MGVAVRQRRSEDRAEPRARFTVVPGRRTRAQASADSVRTATAVILTVVFILALAGIGRVWMSAQAASAERDSKGLESQLKEARALSDELEITHSFLSRNDRIRALARDSLAMGPAENVGHIDLTPKSKSVVADVPDSAFGGEPARADMGSIVSFVSDLFVTQQAGARVVDSK